MALPPEPLATVIVDAVVVVIGSVVEIMDTGPQPPQREGKRGEKDLGNAAPWQDVVIRVERCLRGEVFGTKIDDALTLQARKPEGAYLVAVGTAGAFLIGADVDGVAPILGRYGPDTWRVDDVVRALT